MIAMLELVPLVVCKLSPTDLPRFSANHFRLVSLYSLAIHSQFGSLFAANYLERRMEPILRGKMP